METLYDKSSIHYYHRKYQSYFEKDLAREYIVNINDVEFKHLLLSMPPEDHLYYENRSFKINKDADSLRVSFFDFKKDSNHKTDKHQLQKKLLLTRYILKTKSSNFYVSHAGFIKRKRWRDMKQNFIRYKDIQAFSTNLTAILMDEYMGGREYRSTGDTHYKNVPLPAVLLNEVAKITSILFNELEPLITMKVMKMPVMADDLSDYFINLLLGSILEWFCRKNGIKMDYFWLTKLMSMQYVTKRELKKYDNNYLRALLDYYKLSPDVVLYVKANINDYMSGKFDLLSLSVYAQLYPKGEYYFTYESRTKSTLMYTSRPLVHFDVPLGEVFKMYDPQEREAFKEFLDYLYTNRKYFHTRPVVDYLSERGIDEASSSRIGDFIKFVAMLYRMGVVFNFDYTPDIIRSEEKFMELVRATHDIASQGNSFMVQHYAPRYKSKVESTFILYGTKWQVKLHAKPTFNSNGGYGDFIVHNTSAFLTDLKTGEHIELTVVNPNMNECVKMKVDEKSLKNYFEARQPVRFDMDALGYKDHTKVLGYHEESPFKIFTMFAGNPRIIRRKAPDDSSGVVWALRKVYRVFRENCRYFEVNNQILFPILDRLIQNDIFLNECAKINSPNVNILV